MAAQLTEARAALAAIGARHAHAREKAALAAPPPLATPQKKKKKELTAGDGSGAAAGTPSPVPEALWRSATKHHRRVSQPNSPASEASPASMLSPEASITAVHADAVAAAVAEAAMATQAAQAAAAKATVALIGHHRERSASCARTAKAVASLEGMLQQQTSPAKAQPAVPAERATRSQQRQKQKQEQPPPAAAAAEKVAKVEAPTRVEAPVAPARSPPVDPRDAARLEQADAMSDRLVRLVNMDGWSKTKTVESENFTSFEIQMKGVGGSGAPPLIGLRTGRFMVQKCECLFEEPPEFVFDVLVRTKVRFSARALSSLFPPASLAPTDLACPVCCCAPRRASPTGTRTW